MDTVPIDPLKLYSMLGSPDGLYAWCRSPCEGDHETHSWNVSA
jgi:hypothetical protein